MDPVALFIDPMPMQMVIAALHSMRAGVIRDETSELHQAIALALNASGIAYDREYRLGPRNRIDFFLSGGIGIEAKRGKPNRKAVLHQLERYASYASITGLIVVIEASIVLPLVLSGKPLEIINLHKLWGIAL